MNSHQGFTRIHPQIDYSTRCPYCSGSSTAKDWAIPGMWTMAMSECRSCKRRFLSDLPYGVGLISPCFIDPESGITESPLGSPWYGSLTASAYANRVSKPVNLSVISRSPVTNACLANCLFPWWGDAVSLILRLNQIRDLGFEPVVLTTAQMLWLIPSWVSEVWVLDDKLSATAQWNDSLISAVKELCLRFETCQVPNIFQPASVSRNELAQFTSVEPFDRRNWLKCLAEHPVVTFAWRDDRVWASDRSWESSSRLHRLASKAQTLVDPSLPLRQQTNQVVRLAEILKSQIAELDFGLVGIGGAQNLPGWITDLRMSTIDKDTELKWCRRASESHILIGVHGSHMTLLSGHAGAVLELLPDSKLVNVFQDLLITCEDVREACYLYRLLPVTADASQVAKTALSQMYNYPYVHYAYHQSYYRAAEPGVILEIQDEQKRRADLFNKFKHSTLGYLYGP